MKRRPALSRAPFLCRLNQDFKSQVASIDHPLKRKLNELLHKQDQCQHNL